MPLSKTCLGVRPSRTDSAASSRSRSRWSGGSCARTAAVSASSWRRSNSGKRGGGARRNLLAAAARLRVDPREEKGFGFGHQGAHLVHARGGNDEIGVPREGLLDDFVQVLVPIDAPPAPLLGKPRRRFLPGRRKLDLRPLIGRLCRASRQKQNQATREDVAHDAGAEPARA